MKNPKSLTYFFFQNLKSLVYGLEQLTNIFSTEIRTMEIEDAMDGWRTTGEFRFHDLR